MFGFSVGEQKGSDRQRTQEMCKWKIHPLVVVVKCTRLPIGAAADVMRDIILTTVQPCKPHALSLHLSFHGT